MTESGTVRPSAFARFLWRDGQSALPHRYVGCDGNAICKTGARRAFIPLGIKIGLDGNEPT
jgi:hypothetical protein